MQTKLTSYLISCILSLLLFMQGQSSYSQTGNYSQKMSDVAMSLWKDSFAIKPGKPAKWTYDQGVVLKGIEQVWKSTGNGKYFEYIQKCIDFYVAEDGTIKDYKKEEFNIDQVNNGKVLLMLFNVTGKEKYKKAAQLLFDQLKEHPRTTEGSFWHKKIYPNQVWLDGLYMAQPFYAQYAKCYGIDSAFNDIASQFMLIEKHARNKNTGLLYHGWDESKLMEWSNKETGCSPNYWGRAMGWYGMALVDALDYFPANHTGRDSMISILNRMVQAVSNYQDAKTGLWYDVLDLPQVNGNYKEASASCMLAYTIAKAVRMKYVPNNYFTNAKKAYEGILHEFIDQDSLGQIFLKGTVSVSGLGGKPYRDGSFAYYMSEPVVINDPKGVGAFIMCSTEMELARIPQTGKGKVVVMDNYFNNEWRKNGYGKMVQRHYTWDDTENGGFSLFGELWKNHGAILKNTTTSPTKQSLKNADIFVIVDPDGWKDCLLPNYMNNESANQIASWVKNGGVLLLMTNDSSNCDLSRFNILAEKFGFHFTNLSRNMVKEKEFETGAVHNNFNNPVFKKTKKMYLKEISTIDIVKPAVSIIKKENEVIFATSRYGKGTVFAVGDPWLYNEYLDGRKIPNEYENFSAANELIEWLLMNCIKK